MPNNITAPRVPLIDPRTDTISREWYRFFLTLYELTAANNNTSISDLQMGPSSPDIDLLATLGKALQAIAVAPGNGLLVAQVAVLTKAIQALAVGPQSGDLAARVDVLAKAVQGLQVAPVAVPPQTVMTATAPLDFPNTAAGACSDLTMTVPGAVDGDAVTVVVPAGSVPANGVYFGWVSAANTVTIRYANTDAAVAYNPTSGSFRAVVTRF